MSSTSPTIGLKIPEGSDPFLTEDFAANLTKIDQAFAQRPPSGGGAVDAATLGGSPKSYFYGPHNPPPATGVGSHTHSEYYSASNPPPSTGAGAHSHSEYALVSHGDHSGGGGSSYVEPADIVKSPGRSQPKVIFSNIEVVFNNANGAIGVVTYGAAGFSTPPSIALGAEVGSNWDMIVNLRINTRTTSQCEVRIARAGGQLTTSPAGSHPRIHYVAMGV